MFEGLKHMSTAAALYETDFYDWIQNQARTLRARKLSELDVDNLIEEIESMGRSERRSLKSSLSILLMHLIKWKHQPDYRGRSWEANIQEQRIQVRDILKDSPSLKYGITDTVHDAWEAAKVKAQKETGIDQTTFPEACPWPFDTFMNNEFWPD